jgi:hypothetical protein
VGRVAQGVAPARRPRAAALDARLAPAARDDLPGMVQAFDAEAIAGHLESALLGGGGAVVSCTTGQATYLPGRFALVRYTVEVRDRAGDAASALLNLRVWPDRADGDRYLSGRLDPLVYRARGRPELRPFDTPAASLEAFAATVAAWPIDGDLPMLVDATDPVLIQRVLGKVVPEAVAGELGVRDVRVGRGHYGRQHRCVLRYDVVTHGVDGDSARVFFGKVAADGRGRIADEVIVALHAAMTERPAPQRFRIPRSLGWHEGLGLLLLEELPGEPATGQLIKARARGRVDALRCGVTLDEAIAEAGRVLAALHASAIDGAPMRRAEDDITNLDWEVRHLARISPDLGDVLGECLARADDRLRRAITPRPRTSHGDFSHTQLLFEGGDCGLVDFDTVCRAEPSLDIGHFTAYLRTAAAKAGARTHTWGLDADEMCERFLHAYFAAAATGSAEEAVVRERAHAFETLSLLRLALHSWQKFKLARLERVLDLLETSS